MVRLPLARGRPRSEGRPATHCLSVSQKREALKKAGVPRAAYTRLAL